ncbi:MAG: type II secretion system secretin GspD [Verrucomicrobiae bacterium]|nr:type II secretion system secretin GspD [Verrucomicrobiae bacterium]
MCNRLFMKGIGCFLDGCNRLSKDWLRWVGVLVFSVGLVDLQAAGTNDLVTVNLPAVSLDQAISLYAELTHRTAIRASNLQGRITLQGNGQLTREDAVLALESVLNANGFAVVLQGDKFFKVVPSAAVKGEGVRVGMGSDKLPPADQVVSRIFQVKCIEAKDLQSVLAPMMHGYGSLAIFPRTNTLLITDTAANLLEIAKVIEHLDRPLEAKVTTKFYPLRNAKAKEVVARILELLGTGAAGAQPAKPAQPASAPTAVPMPPPAAAAGGRPGSQTPAAASTAGMELTFNEEAIVVGKVTLAADERTNQVILLTRQVNFPFFDQMIEKLDANTADPLIPKTIPLKYAEAEQLAGLLNNILGQGGGDMSGNKRQRVTDRKTASNAKKSATPATPAAGAAKNAAKGEAEEISIYPDSRTNSLILLGTREKIEWVMGFVKDVDVPLPQVLLQGVIVEVTLDRTDNLGVEILGRVRTGNLDQSVLVNTVALNPSDATGIVASTIPTGAPFGLNYWASLRNANMDILIQALAQNRNIRILSQPIIQTSHNEEARILVGEQRPIVTGTETVAGSTTTTTTSGTSTSAGTLRSTYEMRDIALELSIKPLINPGGLVVFDILQKVDDVASFTVIDNNQVPVISRREANAVVSVQDGEMIILGGLVSNRENTSKTGVPFLSDIPLLGYLFSSTTKEKIRTELMVLLKPKVLATPELASEEASRRRKELELYNRKTLLEKNSLNEEIEKIEKPASVPAEPASIMPVRAPALRDQKKQ